MIKRLTVAFLLVASVSAQTITHVIYINKENRSFDNLFSQVTGVTSFCYHAGVPTSTQCFNGNSTPCAGGDTCQGLVHANTTTGYHAKPLVSSSTPDSDLSHSRSSSITNINGGSMNGWVPGTTYYYADSTVLPWYYSMANTYGLADNHFSSLSGMSYGNHFYLIAAWSNQGTDNPNKTAVGSAPANHYGIASQWTCGAQRTGTDPTWNNSSTYSNDTYTGRLYAVCASGDPNCGPSGDGLAAGTGFAGGTCSNSSTTACACYCASGTYENGGGCTLSSSCSDDGISATACGSGNSCNLSNSIGNNSGSPCPFVTTIFDKLEAVSKTWKYYNTNPEWNGPSYVPQLYFRDGTGGKGAFNTYIVPDTQFASDAAAATGKCTTGAAACTTDASCGGNGPCIDNVTFPNVAYVSATSGANSEHPGSGNPNGLVDLQAGQSWTQTQVQAVFNNAYLYAHSIIFITWDDWGGQPDHIAPPSHDGLSYGIRVPLMCIGPYCKNAVIHTQFDFASVIKCVENIFGTGSLGGSALDAAAIDACAGTGTLSSNTDGMVNTSQTAIPVPGSPPTNLQDVFSNISINGGSTVLQ